MKEVSIGICTVSLRPWTGEEGSSYESRDIRVWIKLSGLLLCFWNKDSFGRVVQPFGDLLKVDDAFLTGNQFIDAGLLVAVSAPERIPFKLKVIMGLFSYVASIQILSILNPQ